VYAGSAIEMSLNNPQNRFLDQEFHIGISTMNALSPIRRIFFQYGMGFNYYGDTYKQSPHIFRFGIEVRLFNIINFE